jgi:superfamily II DNA or RNA helicase
MAKTPGQLVTIDQIDSFKSVRDFPPDSVTDPVLDCVRNLDERKELEPFILSILADTNETPHGPAELVDILTHKVTVLHKKGLSAFILKGKSFPTVRPTHVSHQIYRLEKIAGLRFAILAATGTILDQAKEQFVATAERLELAYAIFDANDIARLLLAHGFFCPRDARRITAGRCRCGYSPKKRILNIFQKQALNELRQSHELGQRTGLIVLPPGSGKTRIAAEDAKTLDSKTVLYVAHTHEILDVAQSEFVAVFGEDEVCRISSPQHMRRLKTVNLTTIQLLANHFEAVGRGRFDYLVVDEFHHAAARTYRRLLDSLDASFLLGLTATPFRADRQDIVELCSGNILVNGELRSGIDSGILSPYHYYGVFDDVDYSAIRYHGAHYAVRDLEKALVIPERDEAIIRKWREHAEGKPTIAFCCSHNHARRMAASFSDVHIPAEVYLSTTAVPLRRRLVASLETGDLNVLCTVDVLNEGADLPFLECLLFLRPTESKRIFFQQLGRGLRRYVGKSHCVVIDFIGNFQNAYKIVEYHGLSPYEEELPPTGVQYTKTVKELLNLPLGCEVHFDEKVIDVFAQQTLSPQYATRHNIGRILLYQYERLHRQLGRKPTPKDIDRYCLLHAKFYSDVFGCWKAFEKIVSGSAQP